MEAGGANQKTIPNPTVPSTSKPSESRSVASDFPQRIDSSVSLSSGSSEEDWLIKVCCPGARHRYCKNASQKVQISSQLPKSGCLHSLNKEDVSVDSSDCRAVTPYQPYPGMPRQESTDLQWLIRLRCPRAQMEQMLACRQSLPAISTSLNKLPSKTSRNSLSGRTKPLESWETQKHFSIAKVSSPPGSTISLCVLLPPIHPLFESSPSSYNSYFPSFFPPFPFSLLSVSPSVSPPIIILPSILLPPSIPPHFFHLLPPFPPYLHFPSFFFHPPFLQLSHTEVISSSPALTNSIPSLFPPQPSSFSAHQSPSVSISELSLLSQQHPYSEQEPSHDFSAFHSHNPFFLPIPTPIQSYRRYQAREKNSDSIKYP